MLELSTEAESGCKCTPPTLSPVRIRTIMIVNWYVIKNRLGRQSSMIVFVLLFLCNLITAGTDPGFTPGADRHHIWTASVLQFTAADDMLARCSRWLHASTGILFKGSGEQRLLSLLPPVIATVMGNGRRRSISCPSCNGQAEGNKLLAPVALAWGLDGSLYVGDFNYIRRIYPSRNVSSIMELRSDINDYMANTTTTTTVYHYRPYYYYC